MPLVFLLNVLTHQSAQSSSHVFNCNGAFQKASYSLYSALLLAEPYIGNRVQFGTYTIYNSFEYIFFYSLLLLQYCHNQLSWYKMVIQFLTNIFLLRIMSQHCNEQTTISHTFHLLRHDVRTACSLFMFSWDCAHAGLGVGLQVNRGRRSVRMSGRLMQLMFESVLIHDVLPLNRCIPACGNSHQSQF